MPYRKQTDAKLFSKADVYYCKILISNQFYQKRLSNIRKLKNKFQVRISSNSYLVSVLCHSLQISKKSKNKNKNLHFIFFDFGLSWLTSLHFILCHVAGFYKLTICQSPPSHLRDYSTCNNARLKFTQFLFQALIQMNWA
jgi:hypothetical protein